MKMEKGHLILGEILFFLITVALASLAAMIQTVGKEFAGENSSFIFTSQNYHYNVPIYILGMALFFGGMVVAYHFLLKKYMKAMKDEPGIRVLFGLLGFLFSAAMLAAVAFSLYARMGMASNLKPEWMMFFTVIGWPAITFVFIIGMMIRACRAHNWRHGEAEGVRRG